MAVTGPKEKKRVNGGPGGRGGGPGRPIGSKNILSGEVKRNIAEFFRNLTIDNLRWRRLVEHALTTAKDPKEFRFWSEVAMAYGFGTPLKVQPEATGRRSLAFVDRRGLPWDAARDPMRAQTDALLADQARQEAEQAKDRAEVQAAAERGEPAADVQTLEVVRGGEE